MPPPTESGSWLRPCTAARAKNRVKFTVAGPGEIVAVDNGDATSFEPFQASERSAYNGLCLVIVRARPGADSEFILKAEAEGLNAAEIRIRGGSGRE